MPLAMAVPRKLPSIFIGTNATINARLLLLDESASALVAESVIS